MSHSLPSNSDLVCRPSNLHSVVIPASSPLLLLFVCISMAIVPIWPLSVDVHDHGLTLAEVPSYSFRTSLSEDTPVHQFLQRNMSILTLQTDSVFPTLHIFLHIDGKLHFPQTVLSMSLSVQIPKHRQKRALSYFAFESVSCHCCMYCPCCSTIVLFSIVPCSI